MHDDDGLPGLADQVRWQWWADAQRQGQSAIARRLSAHDEESATPVVRGGELMDALLQTGWQPPLPALTHPGELAALYPQAVVVDLTARRGSAPRRGTGAARNRTASPRKS